MVVRRLPRGAKGSKGGGFQLLEFIGSVGERWSTVNSRIYLYHVVTFWFCINIFCETLAVWVQFFSVTKVNMGFRLRSSWHGCRIWRATRGGGHCRGGSILTSWYPTILLWGLRRMTLGVLWNMTSWAEVVQKALACPCCNYYPNWHFQHMFIGNSKACPSTGLWYGCPELSSYYAPKKWWSVW